MADLDGVWEVERTGGMLPPLIGMGKQIRGTHGTTTVFGRRLGVPFDVVAHELHYHSPFHGFVDMLTWEDERTFRGRATFRGVEFGQFAMTRVSTGGPVTTIKEQLVKQLDEAHAMEQSVLRMLDTIIASTDDEALVGELEHHRMETEGHALRMRERLSAHGASPSTVRQMGGVLGALARVPLDMVRGERAWRNARDGYATEQMEIATYELLKRLARLAHDEETAVVCDEIIEQERAMAATIAGAWDSIVDLTLREEGVPAS
jgi:ferritin-like metal-binding protein YciE